MMLEALGYKVEYLPARIEDPPAITPRPFGSHFAILVKDLNQPGDLHLVDVGSGHPVFKPVPLNELPYQTTDVTLTYRFVEEDGRWHSEHKVHTNWIVPSWPWISFELYVNAKGFVFNLNLFVIRIPKGIIGSGSCPTRKNLWLEVLRNRSEFRCLTFCGRIGSWAASRPSTGRNRGRWPSRIFLISIRTSITLFVSTTTRSHSRMGQASFGGNKYLRILCSALCRNTFQIFLNLMSKIK